MATGEYIFALSSSTRGSFLVAAALLLVPAHGTSTSFGSIAELRAALATNSTLDATISGYHTVGSPLVVADGKTLVLRGHGAILDGGTTNRLFLVQGGGTLELDGLQLRRGWDSIAGGCILARRHAHVRVHNSSLESCIVSGDQEARGGAIALGIYDGLVSLAEKTYSSDEVTALEWSPDSQHIAFGTVEGGLSLWSGHDLSYPLAMADAVQQKHSEAIESISFAPDGNWLVTASQDADLKVWKWSSTGVTSELTLAHTTSLTVAPAADADRGTGDHPVKAAWAPDASQRIVCITDRKLMMFFWSSATETLNVSWKVAWDDSRMRDFATDGIRPSSIAWAPRRGVYSSNAISAGAAHCTDQSRTCYFATGHWKGQVALWVADDISSGTEFPHDLSPQCDTDQCGQIYSLAYTPTTKRLVTGSDVDYDLKVWYTDDLNQAPETGTGHARAIKAVAFNPEGTRIASASEDRTVKLWGLNDFGVVTLATGEHNAFLSALGWSPDGTRIATGAEDGQLRTWDQGDFDESYLSEQGPYEGHVKTVAWSPDGERLLSGSRKEAPYGNDCSATGGLRVYNRTEKTAIYTIAYYPIRARAYNCSHLRDDTEPDLFCDADPYGSKVWPTSSSWSPDGVYLASGSRDGKLRIYDGSNLTKLQTVVAHRNGTNASDCTRVYSIAWSPTSSAIASVGDDGFLRRWSPTLVEEAQRYVGNKVRAVAWGGSYIASSTRTSLGDYYVIQLWNGALGLLANATCEDDASSSLAAATACQHSGNVNSLAFSPDSTYLASGSDDWTLKVWELSGASPALTLRLHGTGVGHNGPVLSLAFSPDGTKIVSGGGDGLIKVWQAALLAAGSLATGGGGSSGTFGHEGDVFTVAWSADASRIASGSADRRLIMWRELTFAQTLTLVGSTIEGSQAVHGGAISAHATEAATVASSDFTEVAIDVRNSTFNASIAGTAGGALAMVGHSDFSSMNTATVDGSTFDANAAEGKGQGGAMYASDCVIAVSGSAFKRNTGSDGSAINYGGASPTIESTFTTSSFLGNTPDPVVFTGVPISWTCALGQYMPRIGVATGSFAPCMLCLQGYFGQNTTLTEPTCDAPCPKGHYCPEGTSYPHPCSNGTYLPSIGAASNATCVDCPPGSRGERAGASRCTSCGAGTFSEAAGSTQCDDCQLGGYCESSGQASALMAWTACPAGTIGNATGLMSATECQPCPRGHYCYEGRRGVPPEPVPCMLGTYNPNTNGSTAAACLFCEPGTFNNQTGSTDAAACQPCSAGTFNPVVGGRSAGACQSCTRGSFCEAGSHTPTTCAAGRYGDEEGLSDAACSGVCEQGYWCEAGSVSARMSPCSAGSYGNATGLMAQANCTVCPSGHACPEAAAAPTECPPGSVANATGRAECMACAAGTFQQSAAETACDACSLGEYCPRGSSAALSCPSGRFGNESRLEAEGDCHACTPGAFCSTGAEQPTLCSPGTVQPEPGQGTCTICDAGEQQPLPGQLNCSLCGLGVYCPAGSSGALSCPAGRFGNVSGLSKEEDCYTCPAGSFCGTGAENSKPCFSGTFAANRSSPICSQCPEGTYQELEGATRCEDCGDGYNCPAGSSNRIPASCEGGTYLPAGAAFTNQSDCVQCPVSTWCAGGRTAPKNCSVGSFANETGQSSCAECSAGRFQGRQGQTACSECPAGHFCEAGAAVETACEPGRFGSASGLRAADDCEPCPVATYCVSGSQEPSACPAGRYGGVESLTDDRCSGACAAGYVCELGSSSAVASACPAGRFNGAGGGAQELDCLECILGFYCPLAAAEPVPCPPNTTQRAAAVGARSVAECRCQTSFFLSTPAGCAAADLTGGDADAGCTERWQCEPCPDGVVCETPDVELVSLEVLPGYWRQDPYSAEMRTCHTPAACLGGNDSTAPGLCRAGHHGPYCALCDEGLYTSFNLCEPCEGSGLTVWLPLIVLGALMLLALAVAAVARLRRRAGDEAAADEGEAGGNKSTAAVSDTSMSARLKRRAKSLHKQAEERGVTNTAGIGYRSVMEVMRSSVSSGGGGGGGGAKLKILVSFYQVLGGLNIVFDIPYPQAYLSVLNAIASIVSLELPNLMPLGCFLTSFNFYSELVLVTAAPTGLIGLGACGSVAAERLGARAQARGDDALSLRMEKARTGLQTGCFLVLWFIYPACCAKIFHFFVCDTMPDGTTRYLRVDYSIDCDAPERFGYMLYAVLMGLLYPVGTPLVFWLFLRREADDLRQIRFHEQALHADRQFLQSAKALQELHEATAAKASTKSRPRAVSAVDQDALVRAERSAVEHERRVDARKKELSPFVEKLTDGYAMRCSHFEVFECVRKIALVGIPALFTPGSVTQLMLGLLVCFISFGIYTYFKPYARHHDDFLQRVAQVQIFFALLSSLVLQHRRDDPFIATFLTAMLAATPLLALLLFIGLDDACRRRLASCRSPRAKLRPRRSSSKALLHDDGRGRRPFTTTQFRGEAPAAAPVKHGGDDDGFRSRHSHESVVWSSSSEPQI